MSFGKVSRATTAMIYFGTFLLSVLSFFTTLSGLMILLDFPLALIGSLGLQTAMLGIAWNVMKVKENRAAYLAVFMTAAAFSIFFSYANFDSSLKENTRINQARSGYAEAAVPVLTAYRTMAQTAGHTAAYQVSRLDKLVNLEQEKGWATVIDEGSRDPFVQSVLDGARRMVESWKTNMGREYSQGGGRGIIVDYMESRRDQAVQNLNRIESYTTLLNSVGSAFNGNLSVDSQFALLNTAWVGFPAGVVAEIMPQRSALPYPPDKADFVETPISRQQAFMLVIHDLIGFDSLAAFSLLLALAIDMIVILMALAGSYITNDEDFIFDRVSRDAAKRVNHIEMDNLDQFARSLQENLKRYRTASEYSLELMNLLQSHRVRKESGKIVMKRSGEDLHTPSRLRTYADNWRNWRRERQRIKELEKDDKTIVI